ncbi:hypothetical protein KPH14_009313 [Odynerus spinipes]|uniref:Uncharacterized protein n=1 Tax=Odynerus spinipes TaxID=1348599 RepID=A0AAD9RQ65_9HYME|nr:hypothetical protein KPH14_009313 [Odynerus spinipes]
MVVGNLHSPVDTPSESARQQLQQQQQQQQQHIELARVTFVPTEKTHWLISSSHERAIETSSRKRTVQRPSVLALLRLSFQLVRVRE